MRPEIIRLFPEQDREGQRLTEELEAFWRVTQSLAEVKARLEEPVKQAFEKKAELEARLATSTEQLHRITTHVRTLEEQIAAGREQHKAMLAKIQQLSAENARHLANRAQYEDRISNEKSRADRLSAELTSTRQNLAEMNRRYQALTQTIESYRAHWALAVQNDRALRNGIEQQKAFITTQKTQWGAERDKLHARIQQLETSLAQMRKQLQTEHHARKITANALSNYQQQWNSLITRNQKLEEERAKFQEELANINSVREKFGPVEDRELLMKQNSDLRSEIDRLRRELLAKVYLERELTGTKGENDRLITEFAQQSCRFKELADQDHSIKMKLRERLLQAERELEALRQSHAEP